LIGSAEGIDVANGKNEIKASSTYAYYYARFYNSQNNVYSLYSDSVAATGLNPSARGELKREFLSIYNETIDDLITDDWLNRAINRWQRDLSKRRRYWSFLKYTQTSNLVEDQQAYDLPTDIQDFSRDSIISVKVYNDSELTACDQKVFTSLTFDHVGSTLAANIALVDVTVTLSDSSDFSSSGSINVQGDSISYTSNTVSTGVLAGVTGISTTHTSGDEVWQTWTSGQPIRYMIDPYLQSIKLSPIPNSTYEDKNLYIEYWRKFPDLVDDSDETLFTSISNCYLYLNWQLAIRRRLPEQEILSRKGEWQADLEGIVANDPDYRDVVIGPQDMYKMIY
jgi:hypothetical protein